MVRNNSVNSVLFTGAIPPSTIVVQIKNLVNFLEEINNIYYIKKNNNKKLNKKKNKKEQYLENKNTK